MDADLSSSGDPLHAEGIPVTKVDANPDAGFNYPYLYYAPRPGANDVDDPALLVQPNNSGQVSDDFSVHERAAESRIRHGISRRVADELGVPLLIPIFPRPERKPVNWTHYVHELDRDTLEISSGPLERVDRQLIRMVEDARGRLADANRPVREKIIMNGFSAASHFVDRFTVIHPERVHSVTGGGINGMALLPLREAKGYTLDYQVGIADLESLVGHPADLSALDAVDQYYYMGRDDHNDTLPYKDAWTSDRLRKMAKAVYGANMVEQRLPFCQTAYARAGVSANFRVYQNAGHSPLSAFDDVVAFHRRSLAGEDVSDFDRNIQTDAAFGVSPTTPTVGTSIRFDASPARTNGKEILSYSWRFGDGDTAAGEVVTHTFASTGTYDVSLKIVDSQGYETTGTTTLVVGPTAAESGVTRTATTPPPTTTAHTVTTTDGATTTGGANTTRAGNTTTGSGAGLTVTKGPGLGIGSALGGLIGGVAVLRRWGGE